MTTEATKHAVDALSVATVVGTLADVSDNQVQIMFNKIKPRSIGKIGFIELRFDRKLFKYYDLICPDANVFIRNYAKQRNEKSEPMMTKAIITNAGNEFDEPNNTELPF